MALRDPFGGKWPVQIAAWNNNRARDGSLTLHMALKKGWKQLYVVNNLKEGSLSIALVLLEGGLRTA